MPTGVESLGAMGLGTVVGAGACVGAGVTVSDGAVAGAGVISGDGETYGTGVVSPDGIGLVIKVLSSFWFADWESSVRTLFSDSAMCTASASLADRGVPSRMVTESGRPAQAHSIRVISMKSGKIRSFNLMANPF